MTIDTAKLRERIRDLRPLAEPPLPMQSIMDIAVQLCDELDQAREREAWWERGNQRELEGHDAFHAGLSKDDNPYPVPAQDDMDRSHYDWLVGYETEEMDAELKQARAAVVKLRDSLRDHDCGYSWDVLNIDPCVYCTAVGDTESYEQYR